MMDAFTRYQKPIIAVEPVPQEKIHDYGIIDAREIDPGIYAIRDIVEKPSPETAPSNLGAIGRYILAPEIFSLIREVKPGATAGALGAAVQKEIEGRGYRPIANLTGHGLDRYVLHRSPTIPNIGIKGGGVLEEGMVFAIEPFATTGCGHVKEKTRMEIYSQLSARPVRAPAGRIILDKIRDRNGLPFSHRWLGDRKLDLALPALVRSGNLHVYPVLSDVAGSLVSQHEHTVIVTSDGCIVTTR